MSILRYFSTNANKASERRRDGLDDVSDGAMRASVSGSSEKRRCDDSNDVSDNRSKNKRYDEEKRRRC